VTYPLRSEHDLWIAPRWKLLYSCLPELSVTLKSRGFKPQFRASSFNCFFVNPDTSQSVPFIDEISRKVCQQFWDADANSTRSREGEIERATLCASPGFFPRSALGDERSSSRARSELSPMSLISQPESAGRLRNRICRGFPAPDWGTTGNLLLIPFCVILVAES
jgi:hypothetical protein